MFLELMRSRVDFGEFAGVEKLTFFLFFSRPISFSLRTLAQKRKAARFESP